jgi:ABC-type Zn uptake system ZnuABC Zn-binding protein ZnuA
MEIPTATVTRADGDVHPLGNPHFWLDPENGRRIARAFKDKLAELQPADAAFFDKNLKDFEQRLTDAEKRWDTQMAPYKGRKVVTYHRSLPNFAKRFGLDVVDYVEPKPGIPPTPSHTLELINKMKQQNIKLILVEPYFDMRTPNSVAQAVGGTAIVLLPSVGGEKQVQTYFQLFDYDVNLLAVAFGKYK